MGGLEMGIGIGDIVLMILFWTGPIALAIWLIRLLFPPVRQPPAPPSRRDPTARQILDQRFARGEISREEYDLRKTITNDVA